MNNAFYSNLKPRFVIKIFKVLSSLSCNNRAAKQLDRKVEVYFKTYHDKNREKINCKPNITKNRKK